MHKPTICWIIFYALKFQHKQCKLKKWKEKREVEENRFPGYVLVEMVMTDEALVCCSKHTKCYRICRITREQIKTSSIIGTRNSVDILVSMGQKTVQEFDFDVEIGQPGRIIDGAFADYTGKITEIGIITK